MMDFITAPLIVGIVFLGVYKIVELFVCRSERLKIVEKLNDRITSNDIVENFTLPNHQQSRFSFGTLKAGCLMLGIGLGLLVGFFICINTFSSYLTTDSWEYRQISGVVYGSCVLLFGGFGLLTAFFIELKTGKKKKE